MAPRTPPPGRRFVTENLVCTDTWLTDDGRALRIDDMETAHLLAVLGYMRWFAPEIAVLADNGATDPEEFITTTPVWTAVATELTRRSVIGGPELALPHLRNDGLLPWEIDATA